MTTVLCTLYNSLYLDKGLVLYDSLCECAKDFKLYVLCMDDKCYEVLTDLKQEHHIPVRLSDFEAGDEALLAAKGNRSMGEYCWTCSSSFIRYVLKHYGEDSCTYIDADMYFYNDPQVLIDEMLEAEKSVMVVPHRFPEDKMELAKTVGTYCVEFNTFLNTADSLEVLEYWRNRCLESVARLDDGIHYGDQKYLDELVERFRCVHVCKNNGAGVAPWNLILYNVINQGKILFLPQREDLRVVFYHYQNIAYVTRKTISLGISKRLGIDSNFVDCFYKPYLKKIDIQKNRLTKRYGIFEMIQGHPESKHRFVEFKKTCFGQYMLTVYKRLFDEKIIISIK